jgi:hypothetical protein
MPPTNLPKLKPSAMGTRIATNNTQRRTFIGFENNIQKRAAEQAAMEPPSKRDPNSKKGCSVIGSKCSFSFQLLAFALIDGS